MSTRLLRLILPALLLPALFFVGCKKEDPIIAVTSITGVPSAATVGVPLTLVGTVNPNDATNKTIVWSLVSAGTTGATLSGNALTATAEGTVTVMATIMDGVKAKTNFTQNFSITVSRAVLSGTVTITGSHVFDQTLTANTGSLTSTPSVTLGTLSYQWKRGSTDITGATGSTYKLVQADINSVVNVVVTAANCTGSITSGNTATVTKIAQTAPAAPTLSSSTTTSITLVTVPNCEYRLGETGTWQTSPAFTGLTQGTAYSFFQRLVETTTHSASPASNSATFSTQSTPVLGGTVTISGSHVFDQTLTAVTTNVTSNPSVALGTLSYQWRRGSTNIAGATSSTYKLVQDDISSVVNVVVTSPNCTGSVASTNTAVVAKADKAKPAAPTMASNTTTSITLGTVDGCNYRIGTTGAWQTSPTFTGLASGTAYTFYQYYPATATHNASPVSDPATFSPQVLPVLGGTVTITGTVTFDQTLTAVTTGLSSTPSVILGTLSYQWLRNNANIAGATSSTYKLVQADVGTQISVRVSVSNCSGSVTSGQTAAVAKATQTAPAAPTMASRTNTQIVLTAVTGCEYSRGGATYQDSPTFTGLTADASYTFYQRKKATDTHLASSASASASFTTWAFVGQGTVADPFQISSFANLGKLRDLVNAGTVPYNNSTTNYKQTTSITASSTWTPIGPAVSMGFAATYNGGGFAISALTNVTSGSDFLGLFGNIASSGVVRNLAIISPAIVTIGNYVGGVAGCNGGLIEFCYVQGTTNIKGTDYVGGVVGDNAGTVANCYTTCAVVGLGQYVGGIVGINLSAGLVDKCHATGEIIGISSVGGIVGYNYGRVTNCVALSAQITKNANSSTGLGRVVGTNASSVTNPMTNNYARDTGMTLYYNNTMSILSGFTTSATNIHGQNVASNGYHNTAGIGSFWNQTGIIGLTVGSSMGSWTTPAGGLPYLSGFSTSLNQAHTAP